MSKITKFKGIDLYSQGQEIIKLKQKLNNMDYENDPNAELLEDHILELEEAYVKDCHLHNNYPQDEVLKWN